MSLLIEHTGPLTTVIAKEYQLIQSLRGRIVVSNSLVGSGVANYESGSGWAWDWYATCDGGQ